MSGKTDVKNLFDKKQIQHVARMREKFFSTGKTEEIVGVRPEILMLWQETYIGGSSNLEAARKPRVTDVELTQRRKAAAGLLEIAVPYMEKIYDFLDKRDFWITLLDNDGVIIKLVGNMNMMEELQSTGLVEGSHRGENVHYTGLFHLVYFFDKPFMLVATEHSSSVDDDLAGGACPIYDNKTGQRIGIIAICGHWWNSHLYTLGLAIIAAEAISKELALKESNDNLLLANKQLESLLNSAKYGIIYFNKNGIISIANRRALDMLSFSDQQGAIIGKNINSYFEDDFNIPQILTCIKKDGFFQSEYTPKRKYTPLYCVVRSVRNDIDFSVVLHKRKEVNAIATTIVGSAFFTFDNIVGKSRKIQKIKEDARIMANYNPSVLIVGESGTGKELFAQAIHNSSPRAKSPFIAINCGAIPRSLIESELFGYEKGAFTGADKNGKAGKFELANGGTLFLDEIGDMPYELQVTLLRILQTKQVVRIGGKEAIQLDVRIIAATNRNLKKCIEEKNFRSDLFYRLNVLNLAIPPLRERNEDIRALIIHFIEKYCHLYDKKIIGMTNAALDLCFRYSWPGNIRELENIVERAIIVCEGMEIDCCDLHVDIRNMEDNIKNEVNYKQEKFSTEIKERNESKNLKKALLQFNGNLTKTAQSLKISRPTLYRKMEKYQIKKYNVCDTE